MVFIRRKTVNLGIRICNRLFVFWGLIGVSIVGVVLMGSVSRDWGGQGDFVGTCSGRITVLARDSFRSLRNPSDVDPFFGNDLASISSIVLILGFVLLGKIFVLRLKVKDRSVPLFD